MYSAASTRPSVATALLELVEQCRRRRRAGQAVVHALRLLRVGPANAPVARTQRWRSRAPAPWPLHERRCAARRCALSICCVLFMLLMPEPELSVSVSIALCTAVVVTAKSVHPPTVRGDYTVGDFTCGNCLNRHTSRAGDSTGRFARACSLAATMPALHLAQRINRVCGASNVSSGHAVQGCTSADYGKSGFVAASL